MATAVMPERDASETSTSLPISVEDFEKLFAETVALGDKLRDRCRNARIAGAIRWTFVPMFIFGFVSTYLPNLTDRSFWLITVFTFTLCAFSIFEFPLLQDNLNNYLTWFASLLFTSSSLRIDILIFLKSIELVRELAPNLYHNGKMSRLRYETIKLQLSRFDI